MPPSGGETIREMIAGFNQMQMQMGLLPIPSGSMPLGVSLNQPPPPPPVLPPYAIAMQAHDMGMAAMQRTVQAAQVTRYVPPPSMPMRAGQGATWGPTMDALAAQQFNPYVASALGGGYGGLPPPPVSPQYGMYRQLGGRMGGPPYSPMMSPGIMNPYVQFQGPNFATPVQRDYANLQAVQARGSAAILGGIQGGIELGGSLLGGGLGSVFGPLGGLAGSWLGGKAAGALSGMFIDPVVQDLTRGRQLQAMTSPFMVSGPALNPFTGQGLERGAGVQTAQLLRNIARDHDFVRQTGFNQQDVMKLTNLAGEQGLLDTARNPEDIARRMKEVAKSVKALIQITHDPDVKAAMADLGNLRNLGFQGPMGWMGAAQNRQTFARMAGVSQQVLSDQFGMPGAMAAQGLGLAGSTGFTAGIAGAGTANVAISSGSFNDLQLARAGGRAGVSQANMMAALGAVNQDIYMAAALRRDSAGHLAFDTEKFQRLQGMNISDVASQAADRMNEIGAQGISELATRKQEFKDQLARSQSPIQQQLNIARQARAMQRETGLTFGGALSVMVGSTEQGRGMSNEQREQIARTLELQFTNQDFYRGMQQQLEMERRNIQDREAARDAQFRTPGMLTRAGRGIRDLGYGISDALTAPVHDAARWWDEMQEERSAQARGERIFRAGPSGAIQNAGQRRRAAAAGRNQALMAQVMNLNVEDMSPGEEALQPVVNTLNWIASGVGLSAENQENIRGDLAAKARGDIFEFSAGRDRQGILSRTRQAARAFERAGALGDRGMLDLGKAVGSAAGIDATSVAESAATHLRSLIQTNTAFSNAGAVNTDQMRQALKSALAERGITGDKANAILRQHGDDLNAMVADVAARTGDKAMQESIAVTRDVQRKAGALGTADLSHIKENVDTMLREGTGLGGKHVSHSELSGASEYFDISDKALAKFKAFAADQDPEAIALAAMQQSGSQKQMDALRKSLGEEKYRALSSRAGALRQGADEDVLKALSAMGKQDDIMGAAKRVSDLVATEKAASAQSVEVARLARDIPELQGMENASAVDILGKVSGAKKSSREAFERRFPGMLKKFEEASDKGGVAADFTSQFVEGAGGEEVSLVGGESTAAMKRLKEDQDELEKLRSDLGVKDRAFVDAVDIFAEASKGLKETADTLRLLQAGNHGV